MNFNINSISNKFEDLVIELDVSTTMNIDEFLIISEELTLVRSHVLLMTLFQNMNSNFGMFSQGL